MFMQIAIGAIGVGVILMVGYIVVSQVRNALPSTTTVQVNNPCLGEIGDVTPTSPCTVDAANSTWTAPTICGTDNLTGYNTTAIISCTNAPYTLGTGSAAVTVYAGFALVAVGIIVLAAFGLINVFK